MTLASIHKTKLKRVQNKQKHALCLIFNQSKTSPSEPLFLNLNVLSDYQLKIFQTVQLKELRNYNRNLILYPPQKLVQTQPKL